MPTVGHEFDESGNGIDRVRRSDRRRSTLRSAWRIRPPRIFVVKTLAMIVVRRGAEGQTMGTMRKRRWDASSQ